MAALTPGLVAGSAIGGAVAGGLFGGGLSKRKGKGQGDGLLANGLAGIPGFFGNPPATPAQGGNQDAGLAGAAPTPAEAATGGVKRKRKGGILGGLAGGLAQAGGTILGGVTKPTAGV